MLRLLMLVYDTYIYIISYGMLRLLMLVYDTYSLGNNRIHFFCGKKSDTLAAVNIGYDKYPILETC